MIHRFRIILSAGAAAGLALFTVGSALVAGLCSSQTVCGLALLAVYGSVELTVLSYTGTPDIRAAARLALPRGRPRLRREFRAQRIRPAVGQRPALVA